MAFQGYLRQSTASQARLTPVFVDDSDFITPETGLTIANTDVKLSKNAAASVNKNSGGGTHRTTGRYSLTFDATDTDTVGELAVAINVTGATPIFYEYIVLEETVYDQMFAASAAGPLQTGTIAEYGQGAPPLAPTAEEAINYLYRALVRNKAVTDTNTANQVQHFLDNDSTIAFESNITDTSSIFTRSKAQTGA